MNDRLTLNSVLDTTDCVNLEGFEYMPEALKMEAEWWVVTAIHNTDAANLDQSKAFGAYGYRVEETDKVIPALMAHNWEGGMYSPCAYPALSEQHAHEIMSALIARDQDKELVAMHPHAG